MNCAPTEGWEGVWGEGRDLRSLALRLKKVILFVAPEGGMRFTFPPYSLFEL
jgi:hypothetical protein